MPLTLVKEDGTGVVGANAYDTVADFAVWLNDLGYRYFSHSSASARTRFALEGTRLVESMVRGRVTGILVDEDQGLLYPRSGAINLAGDYYESDERPAEYRSGIFLMAEHVAFASSLGVRIVTSDPKTWARSGALDFVVGKGVDGGAGSFWERYGDVWSFVRLSFPDGLRSERG